MSSGHRQLDHTADLALEVWAESEEELLLEGARAVIEIMTGGATIAEPAARAVALDALDRGDRLVQWLNEIVVAATTEGFLFGNGSVELDGATGLRGVLRGESGAGGRVTTELKSATYHDLAIERSDEGWRARVVIDV